MLGNRLPPPSLPREQGRRLAPSLYSAYLYPHLSLPEAVFGKIFREAGSFPEDASVPVRLGKLMGKG